MATAVYFDKGITQNAPKTRFIPLQITGWIHSKKSLSNS